MNFGFVDTSNEDDIIDAYMAGTPACECGECMQPIGDSDTVRCPLCGTTWDLVDYATNGPFSDILADFIGGEMPEGCATMCNHSAWPKCKISCDLFND